MLQAKKKEVGFASALLALSLRFSTAIELCSSNSSLLFAALTVLLASKRFDIEFLIYTCSGLPRLVEYLWLVSVVGEGGCCGQVEKVG